MILLDPAARPIIAHRGASGQYPENTLLAFRQALAQGADAIELDVRLTQDGVPVALHDATVDRTTNGSGAVAEMCLEALRDLDAGGGEPVPTLAEVLEVTDPLPLLIEIKEPRDGSAVVDHLRSAGARGRVLVGSFVAASLKPVRAAGIPTTATRREVARLWAASRVRWSLRGRSYQAVSVPEHRGRLRVVDDPFVRAVRRAGRPVHVWTVDDPGAARRLRSLGVAGILTDFPQRMTALG
jgi:glycerophosphoryl diester phosphodiesterase